MLVYSSDRGISGEIVMSNAIEVNAKILFATEWESKSSMFLPSSCVSTRRNISTLPSPLHSVVDVPVVFEGRRLELLRRRMRMVRMRMRSRDSDWDKDYERVAIGRNTPAEITNIALFETCLCKKIGMLPSYSNGPPELTCTNIPLRQRYSSSIIQVMSRCHSNEPTRPSR